MTRAAVPVRAAAPAPARARSPERWLWGLAAAGEAVLVVLTVGHRHGTSWTGHAVAGAAMIALMAPLIAPNVRYAALRSPRRARAAVRVDVVVGWALPWAVAAAVLGVAAVLLTGWAGAPVAVALATVVAIGWQYTALQRRGLARCDRRFAPPLARRAGRRAARRHGVVLGRDCVLSCWPLMGLMAVAGHDPLVAAACVGVAWFARRRRPHHDPATRETAYAIAAIGATAAVVAVLL